MYMQGKITNQSHFLSLSPVKKLILQTRTYFSIARSIRFQPTFYIIPDRDQTRNLRGDGAPQWVERLTSQSKARVGFPPGAREKLNEFFKVKNVVLTLSVCPTPVCIRTHKNNHVLTLKMHSPTVSEFGGLRKHEQTQHTFAGLGTLLLRLLRRPKFPRKVLINVD